MCRKERSLLYQSFLLDSGGSSPSYAYFALLHIGTVKHAGRHLQRETPHKLDSHLGFIISVKQKGEGTSELGVDLLQPTASSAEYVRASWNEDVSKFTGKHEENHVQSESTMFQRRSKQYERVGQLVKWERPLTGTEAIQITFFVLKYYIKEFCSFSLGTGQNRAANLHS